MRALGVGIVLVRSACCVVFDRLVVVTMLISNLIAAPRRRLIGWRSHGRQLMRKRWQSRFITVMVVELLRGRGKVPATARLFFIAAFLRRMGVGRWLMEARAYIAHPRAILARSFGRHRQTRSRCKGQLERSAGPALQADRARGRIGDCCLPSACSDSVEKLGRCFKQRTDV